MKLVIVAVGNRMPAWVEAACSEYLKRMPREAAAQLIEVKPERRAGGKTPAQVMAGERTRIAAALPQGAQVIALDERGEQWTTRQLADFLQRSMAEGHDLAFVIGGADGLDAEFKRSAARLLALSRLTLPHGLARVLLAEQLYRAVSLLRNHPYHRE